MQPPEVAPGKGTATDLRESLVSVIVPTTGRLSLSAAVASVLAQSHALLEVIVVFDGDGTLAVALPDDERLSIIATSGREGVSAARALGVAKAQGEFLALLDDDDTWEPRKLESQLSILALTDAAAQPVLCASRVRLVDERGCGSTVVPTRLIQPDEAVARYLFIRRRIRWGEAVIHPSSILCSTKLAMTVPWSRLDIHEDWDWLLRLAAANDARVLMSEEPLVKVTETKGSASRSTKWQESFTWVTSTPLLTGRQKADTLLCTTAAFAKAAGNRRAVVLVAKRSFSLGPPGVAACVFFAAFQLFPAQLLTRLARAVPTTLRPRST